MLSVKQESNSLGNPPLIPKNLVYFLIISQIFNLISRYFIVELENYRYFDLDNYSLFNDMNIIFLTIFSIFTCNSLMSKFFNIFQSNQMIFQEKEGYSKFMTTFNQKISMKKVKKIGLIAGIVWSSFFFFGHNINLMPYKNEWITLSGLSLYIHYINYIVNRIFYIFLGKFLITSVWILFIIFYSISSLGTEKYPLKIKYNDLKIGILNQIGKLTITISIPILCLCTFIGINGLRSFLEGDYDFVHIVVAYLELSIGIIFDFILSYLLYRSTLHIHHAIIDYKMKYFTKINNEIEYELNKSENSNYQNIFNLNSAYTDIQRMKDWPFDPTSLKKFIATVSSTLLPLILSIFGFS